MARGKRTILKQEQRQVASQLVNALKFVSIAQKDEADNPMETHCIVGNRAIVAFNGVLGAGHLINEDLICAPHTKRFIDALERCGVDLVITQSDDNVSLRSEKFRVTIPCLPVGTLTYITPDTPVAAVNDILKDGFKAVSVLVADASEHVVTASILLRGGSMVSTNRHVMLEFWHGIDLPPALAIPKAAAMAVAKCTKKLTAFGFSDHSVTFWFEDNSWIRSQRYVEAWPDVDRILNQPSKAWPLPTLFYTAVNAVMPFCEEDSIYLRQTVVSSHEEATQGASYECEGLPESMAFNPKYLKLIEPCIKTIDWATNPSAAYFFGERIRGVVMAKVSK